MHAFRVGQEVRKPPPSRSAQRLGTGSRRCKEPGCRRDEWTWAALQRDRPAGSCPTGREGTGSRPGPTPRGCQLAPACVLQPIVFECEMSTLWVVSPVDSFQAPKIFSIDDRDVKRLVNAHIGARKTSLRPGEAADKVVQTCIVKVYRLSLKYESQETTKQQQHMAAKP